MSLQKIIDGRSKAALRLKAGPRSAELEMLVDIADYILEMRCNDIPREKIEKIPPGYVPAKEFVEKTMVCSSCWLRRHFSKHPSSYAVKVKDKWYVHPAGLIKYMASREIGMKPIGNRARQYLKNHGEK